MTTNIFAFEAGRRIENRGKMGTIVDVKGQPDSRPITSLCGGAVLSGGDARLDIVWDNGTRSRCVYEAVARGHGWATYPEVCGPDGIKAALEMNEKTERKEQADREAAKRRLEAEMTFLRENNPLGLITDEQRGNKSEHATVAANIRKELKAAFPGVKFCVKAKSYSGGSSVTVSWDKEAVKFQPSDVQEITNKYKAGHFDGMTDSYNYESTAHTKVFGSVSYVFAY